MGSREFKTGLLSPAYPGVQRAEAAVAVGLERAHAELLGQGEGLAVGGFGQLNRRGIALCVDDAEKPQGPRLLASQVLLGSVREGPLSELERLLSSSSQYIGLAQIDLTEGVPPFYILVEATCPKACSRRSTASATRPDRA